MIHSYLSPYRTSFFPFSLISVNAVSHCPICHSLKFYLQHVGLLQLTSVGTSFLQQDLNTVLQLSTTYLTATWEISQGNLPSILILAPEFLSSAGFLKRTRGVPAKTNSIQLPFPSPRYSRNTYPHSREVPAESVGFPPSLIPCRPLVWCLNQEVRCTKVTSRNAVERRGSSVRGTATRSTYRLEWPTSDFRYA